VGVDEAGRSPAVDDVAKLKQRRKRVEHVMTLRNCSDPEIIGMVIDTACATRTPPSMAAAS